jgi:hypothetical protein
MGISWLWLTTALLVFKKLRTDSNTKGIYLTEFPIKTFIIFSILGAILIPLTEYLIASVYQQTWDQYLDLNKLVRVDYITFFGFKGGLNILYNQAVYISMIIGFMLLMQGKNKKNYRQ